MKKLVLLNTLFFMFAVVNVIGQCVEIDERDFPTDGFICADEANPTPAEASTDMLDIWDFSGGGAGSSGTDGTADVQLCYRPVILNPNAGVNSCDQGDFIIGAAWGASDIGFPCALDGGTTTADYGAESQNDCVCAHGYVVTTLKMLNGFNSEAGTFFWEWSSINGSSRGYEYGIGFVSAGVDASGNPLTGLNTIAAVEAALATYCNPEYSAGTTMSAHSLASSTGVFALQGDAVNPTLVDCDVTETPDNFTGPNSSPAGPGVGISGLNATDLITEVIFIYGHSNSSGVDCDLDGDVQVSSDPTGQIDDITMCPAAFPEVACDANVPVFVPNDPTQTVP